MEAESIVKLESVYSRYIEQKGNAISILQDIQNEFGYIPEDAVRWIAVKSGLPESKFFGIVTFYTQFHLKERGKNIITACSGTVCHVKGSHRIISRIIDDLKLKSGEDTTRDKLFTLEQVNCIGACSIAPVVVINKNVHGKMNPEKISRELKKFKGRNGE